MILFEFLRVSIAFKEQGTKLRISISRISTRCMYVTGRRYLYKSYYYLDYYIIVDDRYIAGEKIIKISKICQDALSIVSNERRKQEAKPELFFLKYPSTIKTRIQC